MIRRGQAARAGADDQNLLACLGAGRLELPVHLERQVAQVPLDGMDADGAVGESAVTDILARVVTDAPVDRWQGVIPHEFAPGAFEIAFLR
jgi:hypothetical protein